MSLYDRNQKQKSFFNEKIDTYDDVHSTYMETKRTLADNLDKDTKRVLDLGAGTGLELIHVFELFPGAEVTVIDISEKMLEKLKDRSFSNKVNPICGDFFEVSFGEGYDAVISTSALHHFKRDEKLKLYKKIYDSLKDNGQFINCDKIALSEDVEREQLYNLDNRFDEFKHIDTPLTIDHEIEVLKEAGFQDVTTSVVDKDDYRLMKTRK